MVASTMLITYLSEPIVDQGLMVKLLHPPQKLNVCRFGMIEGEGLKLWRRGHLQWHHLPTKFHEKQSVSSKLLRGHRQTGIRTDRLVILQACFHS
jgi:hypothetical protein